MIQLHSIIKRVTQQLVKLMNGLWGISLMELQLIKLLHMQRSQLLQLHVTKGGEDMFGDDVLIDVRNEKIAFPSFHPFEEADFFSEILCCYTNCFTKAITFDWVLASQVVTRS